MDNKDIQVVISGIGGLFPRDKNIQEFKESILANDCLIGKSERYNTTGTLHYDHFLGEISYNYFDNLFYGMNGGVSFWTDPSQKLACERGLEAIIDAGINPETLNGTLTNVYYTTVFSEIGSRGVRTMFVKNSRGYGIVGSNAAMASNRFSFTFNFKGESSAMDGSGASFPIALQNAWEDIASGACEKAVVFGTSIARTHNRAVQLKGLGMLSPDQFTKSFDQNGMGAALGDGSVALLLQPAHQATRCYATLLHSSGGMVSSRAAGQFTVPSPDGMERFLRAAYLRAGQDPRHLAYLEADGMGVPLRDELELLAHERALLLPGRSAPLLVGSVKSNVGYLGNVSGAAAICKALIAMESGVIPATINCREPNARVPALRDGRMQVVTTNTPLDVNENALVGVTTLGVGGDIGHVILKPNLKQKNLNKDSSSGDLPRLVILSGRSEEALARTLAKFEAQPFDAEYLRLVQDVYSAPIRGYEFRTFVVCPRLPSETTSIVKASKRPLWFVYSGMGSQWAGMAGDLMQLPMFRDTIQRLHETLLPKGLDLKAIIADTSTQAFDDIMHSFVAITATQIALTNILTAVGLTPDGMIGHSLGELACGYADGCLTEEQAILAAWARGRASNEATLVKGMMAAVGVGYDDILARLPTALDVACRNSSSSCTLSGPAEAVEAFVSELVQEGVFARSVNVSGIAYHSRYIAPAGPLVRRYLEGVIPEPRPRSSRWVSTSVPLSRQHLPDARLCSEEYLTNNLLSPVLFEQGLRHVPDSALIVEVAPHGLLQAILKRAVPDAQHVSLCRRGEHSQLRHLLAAIGSTSFGGQYPAVSALSPGVEFPVSRGTPSLSPLVEWIHGDINTYDIIPDDIPPTNELYELNDDSPFIKVQDTRLFPLFHMLLLVWKSLALTRRKPMESFGVVFEDVHILDYAELPEEGLIEVNATVMGRSGRFDVAVDSASGGSRMIASGSIRQIDDEEKPNNALPEADLTDLEEVTAEEVRKELEVRGFCYSAHASSLSSIQRAREDWLVAADGAAGLSRVIEGLLQAVLLKLAGDAQAPVLPNYIRRLEVDPAAICDKRNAVTVQYHLPTGIMQGRGIYMAGLTVKGCAHIPCVRQARRSAVKELRFVPYDKELGLEELVCLVEQLLSERSPARSVPLTLLELQGGAEWSRAIQRHSSQVAVKRVADAEAVQLPACGRGVLTACGPGELPAAARLQQRFGGLVLASGPASAAAALGLCELARCRQGALLCRPQPLPDSVRVVQDLPPASLACEPSGPAVLVWRGASTRDIASAARAASSQSAWLRLVFILDAGAPAFSLTDPLYAKQLQLGLFVNVLLGGQWGSWKQMPALNAKRAVPDARRIHGVEIDDISFYSVGNGTRVRDWERGRPVEVTLPGEMALGWSLPGSSLPQVDPVLRWSTAMARTAPWAYAMAYLALEEKARARRGESVLVLDAASPVGQAAVRVAGQLGCEPIFATVASERERVVVEALSPKVRCVAIPSEPLSLLPWLRARTRQRGVDLVLGAPTGPTMHLVLGALARCGRILHTNPHACTAQATAGMRVFNRCAAMYGVTGDQLVCGSQELRQAVARAVSRGIELGTVQPIVQREQINAKSGYCSEASGGHLDSQYKEELEFGTCSPEKVYVIGGGEGSEWTAVAEGLWRCGARHVLAVGGAAAPRNRLRYLTRLGMQVRHLSAPPAAPGQLPHTVAAVILLLKESGAAEEAASAWQPSCAELQVPLLLVRRSQLLQLPALLRAARPGATLLLQPAAPASSAVSGASSCSDLPVGCWLPGSLAALSSLGSRLLSLQPDAVRLRLVRGSLSHVGNCGEAAPWVALPPLGALHAGSGLSALAARLLCPVLCAESRPRTDLRGHAKNIAQAVLQWQWAGPLGLLGWGSSAALAVEVALQLQAAGRTAFTFLLGGSPDQFRTRAAKLAPRDLLAEATAGDAALQEALRRLPAGSEWSAVAAELSSLPPETSGVSTPLVAAGLEAVRVALQVAVDHDSGTVQIPSHLHLLQIRSCSKFSGAGARLHRLLREEAALSSERVALLLNDLGARPQDASEAEVRQQLQRAASRGR